MRTKDEILADAEHRDSGTLLIEVLCDIRDELVQHRPTGTTHYSFPIGGVADANPT